ncbi:MAG TPA: alpha/beta hydrolase [Usitatibacter sp.]|nr:alpha/beta hydrolase [Usitatibacter sp.]
MVVCAHGFSGNARDFDFLAAELSRDARVICPDVAGRGESAWLPSPLAYHFPQYLADFRSLLSHVGARDVHWVGTSMGGLLGMLIASEPASPVRSLVMNDVGAFLPADALVRIARNLAAPARFASRHEGEAHIRATHRDWGEISGRQWAHLVRHGLRRAEDGYRLHYDPQITRTLQPVPFAPGLFFWSAWYRVAVPVLLVRGERSEVFPPSVAAAMLASNPRARRVEIEDAGHAPALMSAREMREVHEFLAEAAPDRRSPTAARRAKMGNRAWNPS